MRTHLEVSYLVADPPARLRDSACTGGTPVPSEAIDTCHRQSRASEAELARLKYSRINLSLDLLSRHARSRCTYMLRAVIARSLRSPPAVTPVF